MRSSVLAALFAAAFLSVTLSVAVHAGSEFPSGSMMGGGMMGRSIMGGSGMMSRMSHMMDGCNAMMQGSARPNDQWRDDRSAPDRGR